MILDAEKISKYVEERKNTPSPSGISCVFIKVEEAGFSFGIKTYRNKVTRDFGYAKQKEMNELGLAPATYGKFDLPEGNERRYCYITEIVDVFFDNHDYYGIIPESELGKHLKLRKNNTMTTEEYDNVRREIYTLVNVMKHHGFYMTDDHLGNFGRTKEGKLVCIDFCEYFT